MTRKKKHGNSEKADYLHIVVAILICSAKNKGLCLGAGVLTIGGGGGSQRFCHKSRGGRDFFSSGIGGGGVVKIFVHHMKM